MKYMFLLEDDETRLGCLIMNSDPDSDGEDDDAFDRTRWPNTGGRCSRPPIKVGKAVREELTVQCKETSEDDDMDWDEEILNEMEGGYDNCRVSNCWDSDNGMAYPLVLAKLPCRTPGRVLPGCPLKIGMSAQVHRT